MQTMIYGPALQGKGSFDNGKIVEQKPIGFPGEGSVMKGIGPLFYWAWATASGEGAIPLHPHQGFEIMTYVTKGQAQHGDTLGTQSTVGAGGAQVMQTGSGVSHEERFLGPEMEAFQIWFEPHIRLALLRQPTYTQVEHERFPLEEGDGYTRKTVLGETSPIELVADARMWDVEVQPGRTITHTVPKDRTLTTLAIRGGGQVDIVDESSAPSAFAHRDFLVQRAERTHEIEFTARAEESLRLLLIEVPSKVDYPLYPRR
ncbi:pirin family protein [Paenibacillus xanthanilyticus]|uniref:Pirin family protein n=1 Tax=Paenibacillus xanthanilyticus TaxID=1783531 RepID=A0ABV8JX08_9BACL